MAVPLATVRSVGRASRGAVTGEAQATSKTPSRTTLSAWSLLKKRGWVGMDPYPNSRRFTISSVATLWFMV
jgi:hypothetical protein